MCINILKQDYIYKMLCVKTRAVPVIISFIEKNDAIRYRLSMEFPGISDIGRGRICQCKAYWSGHTGPATCGTVADLGQVYVRRAQPYMPVLV